LTIPPDALDYRSLSHPRLADEHGVILLTTRQYGDHTTHFAFATSRGIESSLSGVVGQIAAELIERWGLALRSLTLGSCRCAGSLRSTASPLTKDIAKRSATGVSAGHSHDLGGAALAEEMTPPLTVRFAKSLNRGIVDSATFAFIHDCYKSSRVSRLSQDRGRPGLRLSGCTASKAAIASSAVTPSPVTTR